MAHDALAPGDGTYPHFPRYEDGSPNFRAVVGVDAWFENGVWLTTQRAADGSRVVIDVTPRLPDGTPINPPTLA